MTVHAQIRRFAFDRVFTAAAPGDGTPANDAAPSVVALAAELALARQEIALARQDGFEAGLAQARHEQSVALLAAVDALHGALESVDERIAEIADEAALEACEVAVAAAELIAGRALTEMPAAAIDEAIGRALAQIARGQEIQVSVAPALVPEIERLVAVRQAGDRRKLAILVQPDPALATGDAHISWNRGGLILDADARAAAVLAALAGVTG